MNSRIVKLNESFRREISQLLLKEVDFKNALITITKVEVSRDLKHAKTKITILPETKEKEVLQILNKKIFGIQQKINKRFFMHPVPKISFEIDQSETRAQGVEKLLNRIKMEDDSPARLATPAKNDVSTAGKQSGLVAK